MSAIPWYFLPELAKHCEDLTKPGCDRIVKDFDEFCPEALPKCADLKNNADKSTELESSMDERFKATLSANDYDLSKDVASSYGSNLAYYAAAFSEAGESRASFWKWVFDPKETKIQIASSAKSNFLNRSIFFNEKLLKSFSTKLGVDIMFNCALENNCEDVFKKISEIVDIKDPNDLIDRIQAEAQNPGTAADPAPVNIPTINFTQTDKVFNLEGKQFRAVLVNAAMQKYAAKYADGDEKIFGDIVLFSISADPFIPIERYSEQESLSDWFPKKLGEFKLDENEQIKLVRINSSPIHLNTGIVEDFFEEQDTPQANNIFCIYQTNQTGKGETRRKKQ
jgi:hypothetical protein